MIEVQETMVPAAFQNRTKEQSSSACNGWLKDKGSHASIIE
jgi:hypothetical protein